jgi:hypothetical protein
MHVLRALEHQMFEQMSEAGAPLRIVLGADVVPDLHRHIRAGVILHAEHLQAVRQGALLVLDRRNGEIRRPRRKRDRGGGKQAE